MSLSLPLVPESAQLGAEFWKRELGFDGEVKVGEEAGLRKSVTLTEDLFGQIYWRDNETRLDVGTDTRVRYASPDEKQKAHNAPELSALARKTRAVFGPAEREKALNSLYRRLREEAYDIPVGDINIPWGVGPRNRTWESYAPSLYRSALHTITLKQRFSLLLVGGRYGCYLHHHLRSRRAQEV